MDDIERIKEYISSAELDIDREKKREEDFKLILKHMSNSILTTTMESRENEQLRNLDFIRMTTDVLSYIPGRMRMVITKRFGLEGNELRTLEEIGSKEGITRERVRQIEAEAIETLTEKAKENLIDISRLIEHVFGEHGNVFEERAMEAILLGPQKNSEMNRRALLFLLTLLPSLSKKTQNKQYNTVWLTDQASFETAKKLIEETTAALKEVGKALDETSFMEIVKKRPICKKTPSLQNDPIIRSYIATSKEIKKNPFGEWGLARWAEITPKGVKDKAFIIAKKAGKPLHFTEIATKINATKFDHKTAYPQTVHNELIKDHRFVLVGRGIYALKEWGYQPGTVLEVLRGVLKKNGGTMTRDAIIESVLKVRKVRRNTIVLNLQNSKNFEKIDSKTYKIKTQ